MSRDGTSSSMCPCGADLDAPAAKHASGCALGPPPPLSYAPHTIQPIVPYDAQRVETVNHPVHYGGVDNPYEVIKLVEDWGLGFCAGNALKYICRAGKKPTAAAVEDLAKAIWYLKRWYAHTLVESSVEAVTLDPGDAATAHGLQPRLCDAVRFIRNGWPRSAADAVIAYASGRA